MQDLKQMLVLQERKLDEELQKVLKENQKLWIELQNQCEEHEAEKRRISKSLRNKERN